MSTEDEFPEYPENLRPFLNSFLKTTQKWAYYSTFLQSIICFLGLFLNIFQILVLSQKSMRGQATNILIIGMAISDLVYLLYYVDGQTYEYFAAVEPRDCTPPDSLARVIWFWVLFTSKDALRRVSAWLGVFLALVRYLIMRYGTNNRIRVLMQTSTSWKIFFSVFFLSLVITGINQGRYIIMEYPRWVPGEECTIYPPNTTFPWFERVQNPDLQDFQFQISTKYLFIDGVTKILPPIFYPFLALGLISQLKKAQDGRRILMKKEEEYEMLHVTKLIIWMTFSYFLAETPVGISQFIMGVLMGEGFGMILLVNNITVVLITFLIVNSTIHCIFCFSLSSQYRNAVRGLFGCRAGTTGVLNSRNMSTTS